MQDAFGESLNVPLETARQKLYSIRTKESIPPCLCTAKQLPPLVGMIRSLGRSAKRAVPQESLQRADQPDHEGRDDTHKPSIFRAGAHSCGDRALVKISDACSFVSMYESV